MEKLITMKDRSNSPIHVSKSGAFVFLPQDETEFAPGVPHVEITTAIIYGELHQFRGTLNEVIEQFGFKL